MNEFSRPNSHPAPYETEKKAKRPTDQPAYPCEDIKDIFVSIDNTGFVNYTVSVKMDLPDGYTVDIMLLI